MIFYKKISFVLVLSLIIPLTFSKVASATAAEDQLVKKIDQFRQKKINGGLSESEHSISRIIEVIKWVNKSHTATPCVEKDIKKNSEKIVTTFTKEGKPCKVYDLSFPTLRSALGKVVVLKVPVQKFQAEDYLAWLDGDYDTVFNNIEHFKNNFTQNDLQNSWISKIRFKKNSRAKFSKNGIVTSFRLSDLYLGERFYFSKRQKEDLYAAASASRFKGAEFEGFIENPERLLSSIRFDWNELEKVFDVFLEFDFLPLSGPIDLVDYNIQYKLAVEGLIRSVIYKAVNYLLDYVPVPASKDIIRLAFTEVFDFLDMMYDYHVNQMEDTLQLNLDSIIRPEISGPATLRASQILFANRASLVNEYINSIITGEPINLDEFYKVGKRVKYQTEKARKVLLAKLNSDLVLNKGCEVDLHHDYFGACKISGKVEALYSLMSEHNLYFWELGAPMSHYYKVPVAITLKRNVSWLLSVGLRAFPVPVPDFIIGELVGILKGFAQAGMQDEAYLLNYMLELKRSNNYEDEFSKYHVSWLFEQNYNPFLIKSENSQNEIIGKNYKFLRDDINN